MDYNPDLDWKDVHDGGFNTHVGPIRFARIDATTWRAELDLVAKHINMGGVCHGGVYMTLADVAMGASAYEAGDWQRCATIDFDAHFLAAAKKDQTLVCDVTLKRLVSGIAFMECTISAGGRACLTANGIWKFLKSAAKPETKA